MDESAARASRGVVNGAAGPMNGAAGPMNGAAGPMNGAAAGGRKKGFASAHEAGNPALRRAAGRRGVAETRLFTHWNEIAGEAFAAMSTPIRVAQRGGHALGGVLVLAADGPRASELEHAAPLLIERVNAFYGYAAIAEIKLTQAAARTERPSQAARIAATSDLPEGQRAALTAMTEAVNDEPLREALARLGANVMTAAAAKRKRAAE